MVPKIKVGEIVYIQSNAPLTNRDFGLFEYNGNFIFRRFIVRKKDLVLRAEDNSIEDIILTKDSKFNILGKVLGTSDPIMSKFVVLWNLCYKFYIYNTFFEIYWNLQILQI